MPLATHLAIGLHRRAWPVDGLGRVSGNGQHLLGWLETRLGLSRGATTVGERVRQFAARLAAVDGASYRDSLTRDRWRTARYLLSLRDDLRLRGWSGVPVRAIPQLADLARVEAVALPLAPGPAERLAAVSARLAAGLRLPHHQLVLDAPIADWPAAWRPVLHSMTWQVAPSPAALADAATALGRLQRAFAADDYAQVRPDASLVAWRAGSPSLAVNAVATALSTEPDILADTVICCADDALAAAVDDALTQLGLPTAGSTGDAVAHPVLQILPLILALSWEPVDPAVLLEFLALPVSPVPAFAARRLAEALAEQPGLHSRAWDAAVERLTAVSADATPEQRESAARNRERIEDWLHIPRVAHGQPVPADVVAERAARLADWARRNAAGERATQSMQPLLLALAATAAELADLVRADGQPVLAHDVSRLLSLVQACPEVSGQPARVGGPRRIRSLAELDPPCARLLWLGRQAPALAPQPWTDADVQALRAAGVEADDGVSALRALRAAELRGLGYLRDRLTLVEITSQDDRAGHPLWARIVHATGGEKSASVWHVGVAQVLAGRASLAPWRAPVVQVPVAPPPNPELLWQVPGDLLAARETESASSLQRRLTCPLAWTLHYLAKVRPAGLISLPDQTRLSGLFAHAVLDEVFRSFDGLPSPEAAERKAIQVFEERVAKDAAPLARPEARQHRLDLGDRVRRAAGLLVRTLRAGGFDRLETEATVEATLFGKSAQVRIDGLATAPSGRMAVIDVKNGRLDHYRHHLEKGHATQLYFYAAAVATRHDVALAEIPVAYLSLGSVAFATPAAQPLPGTGTPAHLPKAPAVPDAWAALQDLLPRADRWLQEGAVPARPLQAASEWPDGLTTVVPAKPRRSGERPDACKWCDHALLCGAAEVR